MNGWARTRVKWVADEVRETVDPAALDSREVFQYSIPSLDEFGDGTIEPTDSIGSTKLRLRGGEVLISKLNPRISRVFIASGHFLPTLASTEFIALVPGSLLDSRFACYWLQSEVARQFLDGATMSVTRSQQRVRPEVLTGSWIDVPPVNAQGGIADYLDRETARIDSLIDAKHRMIQLLQQRWIAVRSELTRTPDLSSRLNTIQLRRIARLQAGAAFPHERQGDPDGTIPYVKVGDLPNVDEHDQLRGSANRVTALASGFHLEFARPALWNHRIAKDWCSIID